MEETTQSVSQWPALVFLAMYWVYLVFLRSRRDAQQMQHDVFLGPALLDRRVRKREGNYSAHITLPFGEPFDAEEFLGKAIRVYEFIMRHREMGRMDKVAEYVDPALFDRFRQHSKCSADVQVVVDGATVEEVRTQPRVC